MFVENLFPPIPSEVILPLAGYWAAQGRASLAIVIVAGTLGSVAGAALWYSVGRWIGTARLKQFAMHQGRWLTLTPTDIDEVSAWFARHGRWAVLFGRLLPGIRTLISVPAGVTAMPVGPFLLWTTIGSAAWTTVLVVAGYELAARYERIATYVEPVSNTILALAALWYLRRVATFGRTRR